MKLAQSIIFLLLILPLSVEAQVRRLGHVPRVCADTEIAQFNASTGIWDCAVAGGGTGDITDVGPGCATGACFTDGLATTGTTLLIWEGTAIDANDFTFSVPSSPTASILWTVPDGATSLTFPSGTTTVAAFSDDLGVFAATTSAQLAGVLSDETGTLLSVFSDAPTFTTNITTPVVISGAADPADTGFLRAGNAENIACAELATPGVDNCFRLNATDLFQFDAGLVVPSSIRQEGGDPADAGYLRLDNAATVCWEASPAAADVCISVDATEVFNVDGTAVVLSTRTITTGDGLSGGGDLSANRTFAVDLNATADGVGSATNLSGLEFTATSELALLQGCADGDVLQWIEATSQWDCDPDDTAAGGGDAIEVEQGDDTGIFDPIDTTGRFEDQGDINFVFTDGGAGGPDTVTALVRADSVALATDTTGNFIASLSDGIGLTGFPAAAENATGTPALNFADTLAGNPTFNAEECVFSTDGAGGGGFLCEGTAGANINEQLYLFPAVDNADSTDFIVVNNTQVTSVDGVALTITGGVLDVDAAAAATPGYVELDNALAGTATAVEFAAGVAGDGIVLDTATAPDSLDVDLNATADGVGSATNLSGLEFTATAELALLQGCADGDVLQWIEATSQWDCDPDDTAAGGGDAIEIEDGDNAGTFTAIDTTARFDDQSDINFQFTDGGAGGPDTVDAVIRADAVALTTDTTGNYIASLTSGTGLTGFPAAGEGATGTPALDFSQTLAGNPGLAIEECVFSTDGAGGGGFLCEGTAANLNEQLYLFPAGDGADTTNFFALGASDGDALAGDTATAFFDAGTIEAARGGTGLDTSGSTGVSRVDAGTWSVSELSGDVTTSGSNATTIAAGAVASAELATVNKTFKCNFTLFDSTGLLDGDDINTVSNCSRPGRAITLTEVHCETDAGTPSINLQRDDGTPANILTSDLTCTTGGANGTIAAAEDNFAATDKMDFVMVAASTANRISVLVEYTVD